MTLEFGIDFLNAETKELILELTVDTVKERDSLMDVWDNDGNDDRFPELGNFPIRCESWSRLKSELDVELSSLLSIWTK